MGLFFICSLVKEHLATDISSGYVHCLMLFILLISIPFCRAGSSKKRKGHPAVVSNNSSDVY